MAKINRKSAQQTKSGSAVRWAPPARASGWGDGWNGPLPADNDQPAAGWTGGDSPAADQDIATSQWSVGEAAAHDQDLNWARVNGSDSRSRWTAWTGGSNANDNYHHWSGSWADAESLWNGVREFRSLSDLLCEAPWATGPLLYTGELAEHDLNKIAADLAGQDAQRCVRWMREAGWGTDGSPAWTSSLDAQPLHTEGSFWETPPSLTALYFNTVDPRAGRLRFLSIYNLVAQLDSEWSRALREGVFCFADRTSGCPIDTWHGPLLGHDSRGRLAFRWRDDTVMPIAVDGQARSRDAIEAVKRLIKSLPPMEFTPQPGQLIIWPNWTWLQGRERLNPDTRQLLWRTWIP